MSENPVGFGLLGAGLVAPFHAKSLRSSSKATLVAVADMNRERAEKLAKEYECKCLTTLDELLDCPGVEAICVLTPNHAHHDVVIAAARAGKHVLVEKPPAMTLRETDSMIAACKEADVRFGIVLQCRVRKAIQAMKKAIESGRFGRLLHADAYMKWFRSTEYYLSDGWRSSRASGAGVTVQHAFHYIDLLQYLAGPGKRIWARMNNLSHPQVDLEDTVLSIIEFESGAQGVVEASTGLWPGTDIRIEINGENGTAIMLGERMQTWKFRDEQPEDEEIRRYGSESIQTAASGPADFAFFDHKVVIEDMADAIREHQDPCIPAISTRPSLEMVLAMYQSARVGDWVPIPLESEQGIL
ncbi:MAG TPA: Gfo/Idh/MocA family oxidoreductase [bacterium]|nr:Gfo/Idh/MocA family oxidoreductase [bacterium]HQP97974.1 Gfo/Idh/MocA family oxidoreductase [bacterium]